MPQPGVEERSLIARALELETMDRIREMQELLETLTRRYPRSYEGWCMLAGRRILAEDDEGALAAARSAIAIAPAHPDGHTNAGIALRRLGRLDESLTCLCEATRCDPCNPIAHHQLARTREALGQQREAIIPHLRAIAYAHRAPGCADDLIEKSIPALAAIPPSADTADPHHALHRATTALAHKDRAAAQREVAPLLADTHTLPGDVMFAAKRLHELTWRGWRSATTN